MIIMGDRMLVFDAASWHHLGHDVGSNAIFWRKGVSRAIVV